MCLKTSNCYCICSPNTKKEVTQSVCAPRLGTPVVIRVTLSSSSLPLFPSHLFFLSQILQALMQFRLDQREKKKRSRGKKGGRKDEVVKTDERVGIIIITIGTYINIGSGIYLGCVSISIPISFYLSLTEVCLIKVCTSFKKETFPRGKRTTVHTCSRGSLK